MKNETIDEGETANFTSELDAGSEGEHRNHCFSPRILKREDEFKRGRDLL